jgi:hypothetical protein
MSLSGTARRSSRMGGAPSSASVASSSTKSPARSTKKEASGVRGSSGVARVGSARLGRLSAGWAVEPPGRLTTVHTHEVASGAKARPSRFTTSSGKTWRSRRVSTGGCSGGVSRGSSGGVSRGSSGGVSPGSSGGVSAALPAGPRARLVSAGAAPGPPRRGQRPAGRRRRHPRPALRCSPPA